MRILLAGAAAAAFAFAATPAFAQYGGSPAEQVDGAPDEAQTAPSSEDEAEEAANAGEPGYADDDAGMDPAAGVPGKEVEGAAGQYAAADPDADIDPDMDPEDAGPAEGDEVAGEAGEGPTWQGEDGRTYCRRSDGTTGLVVGGGAGALVGRGIDGGRRRGTGTIIGAIVGAVIGSAVERNASQQNCR